MKQLSYSSFLERLADFDAAAAATPGIDTFCSSSDWIIPAAEGLMPGREPWIVEGEHGFGAFMLGAKPDGLRFLEPFEAMWGLACPLVGADPEALSHELADEVSRRQDEWELILICGLPRSGAMLRTLATRLRRNGEVLPGQQTVRHVASLEGGLDGFMARRSSGFRRSLRRALARAEEVGIEFESAHGLAPARAFERMMAVEARSWKGRAGLGIDTGSMRRFYELMLERLALRKGQRIYFARLEDRDVAYVVGAVYGPHYRGLQFSFDEDLSELSLGNLCQYRQILELAEEDFQTYDLGTGLAYKSRWAEQVRETESLIALNGSRVVVR